MMRREDTSVSAAFAANEYAREKKYWMNQLSGDLTRSSFPCDYHRKYPGKNVTTPARLGSVKFKFTGELFLKLIRAINQSDSRLFMILVTALVILLHKYAGNEDIIVGAPIDKQEIEGEFINTILALRNRLTHDLTFKELLLQVRQTIVEACENQNYPIETIAYDLDINMGANDDFPLFDTAILLQNIHDKNYIHHINLNLIFSFLRTHECILGEVEYNTSLYEKNTIQRIINHFTYLLQQVFINMKVNAKITNIDILTEEDKELLLVEMNNTRQEYPESRTIHELVEAQVEKKPRNIAVTEADTGGSISYKKLNETANQLAGVLREKGLGPGTTAAIMGERKLEITAGILAILKTGAGYLPIDAKNPADRIKFIIEDSSAYMFLSQKHIIQQRDSILQGFYPGNIISIDDERIYQGKTTNPAAPGNSTDAAYIIYTSGTTGKPKGVLIEHTSLVNYICWAANNYVKNEPGNFPLYTSISFDLTVTSIFTPLVTGNAIVLYSGWDDGNLIERIVDDNKVEVVKLTPSHLKLIREKKIAKNTSCKVKRFIVGGEILEYQIAQDIYDNFNGNIEIYNEYGPTEAAVGCMIYKFDMAKEPRNSVPIGVPAANTCIYLLDTRQRPVPIGVTGELYISGTGLSRGYLNNPGLTHEKFKIINGVGTLRADLNTFGENKKVPGSNNYMSHRSYIYKTGDLARRLPDGNIEFLGRKDQQVKIRGFRIELGEIESKIREYQKGVNRETLDMGSDQSRPDAVVIDKKDESGDKFLCSYIAAGDQFEIAGLRAYLSEKLPDYMLPSYFIKIDKIPLTSGGKIDRNALPEAEPEITGEYTLPRNSKDKRLAAIWSELLNIEAEKISIDLSFFELGGHSLRATSLVLKLHKELNIKVTLVDIFRMPTIRELSDYLTDAKQKRFPSIQKAEKKEYYPLSSVQVMLYTIWQMNPESTSYNMPFILTAQGQLSIEKMEYTSKKLIERHDILRTSFQMIAEEPKQGIDENFDFKIQYHETGEEQVNETIDHFIRPFDLNRAPLLRMGLLKLQPSPAPLNPHPSQEKKEDKYLIMVDMHHIISDGFSLVLLMEDFMSLYQDENLPRLNFHYQDFAQWENSREMKERMESQKNFWLNEFKDNLPRLNLPIDFIRPTEQRFEFEGHEISFHITEEKTQKLNDMVSNVGATLFMGVLALYNTLLYKLGKQEDILIGTVVSGRNHECQENMIGMFVNTLLIRNFPSKEKTFIDFLQEVKEKAIQVYENQDYQYENLAHQIRLNRELRPGPLFDVMFSFDNIDLPEFEIPGVKIGSYSYGTNISKFDLALHAKEKNKILGFSFEYFTRIFKKETIEWIRDRFLVLIDHVLENPDSKIKDLEFKTSEEKELYKIEDIKFDF